MDINCEAKQHLMFSLFSLHQSSIKNSNKLDPGPCVSLKITNSLCLGMTEDSRLTRPVLPCVSSLLLEEVVGQELVFVASHLRALPCPKSVNMFLSKI